MLHDLFKRAETALADAQREMRRVLLQEREVSRDEMLLAVFGSACERSESKARRENKMAVITHGLLSARETA